MLCTCFVNISWFIGGVLVASWKIGGLVFVASWKKFGPVLVASWLRTRMGRKMMRRLPSLGLTVGGFVASWKICARAAAVGRRLDYRSEEYYVVCMYVSPGWYKNVVYFFKKNKRIVWSRRFASHRMWVSVSAVSQYVFFLWIWMEWKK